MDAGDAVACRLFDLHYQTFLCLDVQSLAHNHIPDPELIFLLLSHRDVQALNDYLHGSSNKSVSYLFYLKHFIKFIQLDRGE